LTNSNKMLRLQANHCMQKNVLCHLR